MSYSAYPNFCPLRKHRDLVIPPFSVPLMVLAQQVGEGLVLKNSQNCALYLSSTATFLDRAFSTYSPTWSCKWTRCTTTWCSLPPFSS